MRALPFLLKEALVNLRRHRLMTAAAITTIAAALTLFGAFALAFHQVQTLLGHSIDAFEVRVFSRPGLRSGDLSALTARLRALPEVASVTYLPREQAFAEAARDLPIDTAGIPNVFPDTFVLKLRSAAQAPQVARTIRGWRREVENLDLPEQEMHTLVKIAGFVRTLGALLGTLLLLGTLVVVANTIRLSVFSRRREIRIMQIVGATPWFIRLPLLIEGLIHGAAGGAAAALLLTGGVRYVDSQIVRDIPLIAAHAAPVDLLRLGLWLTAGGVALGVGGSLLSIRRYLRTV